MSGRLWIAARAERGPGCATLAAASEFIMRSLMALTLFSALLLAQVPAELIPRIIEEGKSPKGEAMKHLDELVNGIGPRLTGSKNLTAACDWARDKFASYGLAARIEPWGEVAVGFDRGPHAGVMFTSDGDGRRRGENLVFGTNAWTAGTDGWQQGAAVLSPKDDKQMAACAKTCRACAKECREMAKMAK